MNENEWWQKQGYLAGRPLGEGLWICLARMAFTYRVMLCSDNYVYGFACYEDLGRAKEAYEAWDGLGLPLGGYTRTVNLGA